MFNEINKDFINLINIYPGQKTINRNFINADLIAQGLSPFKPDQIAIEAMRIMIQHIDECVKKNESFAFETTFSGKGYVNKIKDWKKRKYEIIIYYLRLPSVEFAIERVKLRVAQGGHNVPEQDIRRRFQRSLDNFEKIYKPLADAWIVYDTSGNIPVIEVFLFLYWIERFMNFVQINQGIRLIFLHFRNCQL